MSLGKEFGRDEKGCQAKLWWPPIKTNLRIIITIHRAHFQAAHKSGPTEFAALWDWAEKHGIIQQSH